MSFPFNSVLILLVLIFLNALFVMSELAIVSSRKVRLQQSANQGDKGARIALKLANDPNNFLAAVQIGITMIAIVSGAFGEQIFSKFLYPILEGIPFLKPYSETLSFGIAILIVTYLTLILGELVPKRLALNSPESIARSIAGSMNVIAKMTAPVVYILSRSTDLVLKILGVRPSEEPQVTEEEIRVLIEQGTEAGMFKQGEEDIMKRVFQLGDRRVTAIMTPRVDIIWLDIDDPYEENLGTLREGAHARFPVCQDGLDNLLGLVKVYDLLMETLDGQQLDLTKSLQKPVFVPESTRALRVLELFQQTGNQLAFVVDEYGVTQGLVTLTDIFQALVGDLPSAEELEEPQAIQREDGSWLFDGMLPVHQFKEILELDDRELPSEHRGTYHTLGGFVVMYLGRIPISADHFTWGNLRFEVMDMDGNRVDKVMVSVVNI